MIAGVFAPDFLATSVIGDALLKPSLLHLLGLLWEQLRDLLAQIFHFRVVRLHAHLYVLFTSYFGL